MEQLKWDGSYLGKFKKLDVVVQKTSDKNFDYICLTPNIHGFYFPSDSFLPCLMDELAGLYNIQHVGTHCFHLDGRCYILVKPFIGYPFRDVVEFIKTNSGIMQYVSKVVNFYKMFGFNLTYSKLYYVISDSDSVVCMGKISHEPSKMAICGELKRVISNDMSVSDLLSTDMDRVSLYTTLTENVDRIMAKIGEIRYVYRNKLLSSVNT